MFHVRVRVVIVDSSRPPSHSHPRIPPVPPHNYPSASASRTLRCPHAARSVSTSLAATATEAPIPVVQRAHRPHWSCRRYSGLRQSPVGLLRAAPPRPPHTHVHRLTSRGRVRRVKCPRSGPRAARSGLGTRPAACRRIRKHVMAVGSGMRILPALNTATCACTCAGLTVFSAVQLANWARRECRARRDGDLWLIFRYFFCLRRANMPQTSHHSVTNCSLLRTLPTPTSHPTSTPDARLLCTPLGQPRHRLARKRHERDVSGVPLDAFGWSDIGFTLVQSSVQTWHTTHYRQMGMMHAILIVRARLALISTSRGYVQQLQARDSHQLFSYPCTRTHTALRRVSYPYRAQKHTTPRSRAPQQQHARTKRYSLISPVGL